MIDKSTNAELSTEAPLAANPCYVPPFSATFLEACIQGMKRSPDKYFDLAVCDPPYGIGMDNSNKRTKPSRPNSYTQYPDFRYHKTDWDKNRPTQEYFDELFRVSKIQIPTLCKIQVYPIIQLNGLFCWVYSIFTTIQSIKGATFKISALHTFRAVSKFTI